MPRLHELTSELASLRSDWHELDRACGELPESPAAWLFVVVRRLAISGARSDRRLMHLAMTRLDDRIEVVERNIALAHADQSPRMGAAA